MPLSPQPTDLTASISVSNELLQTVLEPYKPHCRYLQTATVEHSKTRGNGVTAVGEFSIAESCYIADTGHFNAVEFNICYNQLSYCLLAQCVQDRLLDALDAWDLAEYQRRQLSDFLIVEFISVFRKPMNAREFRGQVKIDKVATRRESVFMKTTCNFEDCTGGWS